LHPAADAKHFHKLSGGDEYASAFGTPNRVEAAFDQGAGSDDIDGLEMRDDLEAKGNIKVTRQWDVRAGTGHSS
jgi:hypothetical protein